MVEHLSPKQRVAGSSPADAPKPKSVRLQERKSTYCSAIWTLMKAASRHERKYRVSATLRDGSLWIPQGRMCPKEIYNVLMQEFAGFYKISVDVRYWLILSVSTGSNAGRCGWDRSSSQSVSYYRSIAQLVSASGWWRDLGWKCVLCPGADCKCIYEEAQRYWKIGELVISYY